MSKPPADRQEQKLRKRLREAHLSPEMKASFKAINIWVAAMYAEKNKDKIAKKKETRACAKVRANRRKLIKLSESQNHRCCYCGDPTWHPQIIDYQTDRSESNKATLEHLLPASQGGTYRWENLAMACSECNTTRGDLPLETFIASIQREQKTTPIAARKVDETEKEHKRRKAEKSERNRFRLFMTASWMSPENYEHVMKNVNYHDVKNVFRGGGRRTSMTRKKSMGRIRRRVKINRMAA